LDVRARIQASGVVPVVAIGDAGDATSLGAALLRGGLPCVEITLRTPAGIDAIARIRRERSGLLVGAGTVLDPDQARRAIDAGAEFVVMPGLREDIVRVCRDAGVPVFPGVLTPTEVMEALALGITDLKLFPAASIGGIEHMRALSGPFPMVRFVPTGGVGPANLASYLAEGSVLAVGGSWMVRPEVLAQRDWAAVEAAASAAAAVVAAARAEGRS
jgi:2-dehydro-3-deoxyphosphogluconate aldolase/(4S)-4-hydroxy-2-oxoglutarate aldolase